jgi:DNA (cytosine-5)-methyltransferase 1
MPRLQRAPLLRTFQLLPDELVIDNFAGGGGASTGIEQAIGRPVDIAINHSAEAIAMHEANHPETRHYREDIWDVDPREACQGKPVGIAWFSPTCTHFSRAKGTQPLDKKTRALAWIVVRWAEAVRPRVILLENVEEFQTWGPLDDTNRPIKERAGEDFRAWLGRLSDLGYSIEFRSLVAADYGTPTTRRRLFLIARRDRGPLVFPEPTHGKTKAEPWRPAADVIDWTLPCTSIFDRKKKLADATMRRIARGIRKYVIESPDPFIVAYYGQSDAQPLSAPLNTVTTRDRFALVSPFIVRHGHWSTITGAGMHDGKGPGRFRGQRLSNPLATTCMTNDKSLVIPFVAKHFGGPNGNQPPGLDARLPLGSITTQDHHGLVAAFMTKFYGTSTGSALDEPAPAVTAGGQHLAEVRAFLNKCENEEGLVTIRGETYQIVDIGMRMLAPHELFAAQGFPPDYNIAPTFNGKPLTKTAQIALAGNSVCPPVAAALVSVRARSVLRVSRRRETSSSEHARRERRSIVASGNEPRARGPAVRRDRRPLPRPPELHNQNVRGSSAVAPMGYARRASRAVATHAEARPTSPQAPPQ